VTLLLESHTWRADTDGDGFDDANISTSSCALPTGYVANDDDCDDTNAAVNPDGTDVCNGIDNDCDTLMDENGCTPPVVTVWISPAVATTTTTLSAGVTTYDADGQYVTVAYVWTINASATPHTSSSLDLGAIGVSAGDLITVEVIGFDGEFYSPSASASLTVN
jgi:hypothetical protein